MSKQADIGVIGMGVMGQNLALNLADSGYQVSVYNRHVPGSEEQVARRFVEQHPEFENLQGFEDLQQFIDSLKAPRNIMQMIKAGAPVDQQIEALLPMLEVDDLIMDGGNSHFRDTQRRFQRLRDHGIHYLGVGISGGEAGARNGAAVMPGGSKKGYDRALKFLESIAALDKNDQPCCSYIGPDGAGHFVKMMHNGIEYGEMQLIAEAYDLIRNYADYSPPEIADIFEHWNEGGLESYLLGITADILRKKEGDDYLIDKILDASGQKGTGGWSTIASVELGQPVDTILEAVMARNISAMKETRLRADRLYEMERGQLDEDQKDDFCDRLRGAYRGYRLVNHAIGFEVLREASAQYGWSLNLAEVARLWTNGCIIRSGLMEALKEWFKSPGDKSLLEHPEMVKNLKRVERDMRSVVAEGIRAGYSMPVSSSAVNYLLALTRGRLPANLIQAQRDYFGAHTYRRNDRPASEHFHTNWKTDSHD